MFTGARLAAEEFFGDFINSEDKWRVKCKSSEAEICSFVCNFGFDGLGENVTVTCTNTGQVPPPSTLYFVPNGSCNGDCVATCESAEINVACESPGSCSDFYEGGVECFTLDNTSGPDGTRSTQFKQFKDDDGKKGFEL